MEISGINYYGSVEHVSDYETYGILGPIPNHGVGRQVDIVFGNPLVLDRAANLVKERILALRTDYYASSVPRTTMEAVNNLSDLRPFRDFLVQGSHNKVKVYQIEGTGF